MLKDCLQTGQCLQIRPIEESAKEVLQPMLVAATNSKLQIMPPSSAPQVAWRSDLFRLLEEALKHNTQTSLTHLASRHVTRPVTFRGTLQKSCFLTASDIKFCLQVFLAKLRCSQIRLRCQKSVRRTWNSLTGLVQWRPKQGKQKEKENNGEREQRIIEQRIEMNRMQRERQRERVPDDLTSC